MKLLTGQDEVRLNPMRRVGSKLPHREVEKRAAHGVPLKVPAYVLLLKSYVLDQIERKLKDAHTAQLCLSAAAAFSEVQALHA